MPWQAVHLNPAPSATPRPLPNLTGLTALQSLDLSENMLLRVPPSLSSLACLENLSLRDNSLLQVRWFARRSNRLIGQLMYVSALESSRLCQVLGIPWLCCVGSCQCWQRLRLQLLPCIRQ